MPVCSSSIQPAYGADTSMHRLLTLSLQLVLHNSYKVTDFGAVDGEAAMMAEVFERGPIVCGFVSDDAFDFGKGKHTVIYCD